MSTMIEAAAGDGIEAAIRREHEAASTAARSALDHALECGRLLAQAREGIAHGGWESFVRDRCGIAPRTARLYLRLDANRGRLANRQHVAGLTVAAKVFSETDSLPKTLNTARQAARELAEPRVKAEPEAAVAWDYLGASWVTMTCTGCTFDPEWRIIPAPMYEDADGVPAPRPPAWYSAGHRHIGRHDSGWCFEITPDPLAAARLNMIVHDAAGTLHLASFDGMSPSGIMPFLTACERHHGMPQHGVGWTLTAEAVLPVMARLAPPFAFRIFDIAARHGHRCCCWALIDEATGVIPAGDNPGMRAWRKFGDALAGLVESLGESALPGARRRGMGIEPRRKARQEVPA